MKATVGSAVPAWPRKLTARSTPNSWISALMAPVGLQMNCMMMPTMDAVVTTGRKNMVRKAPRPRSVCSFSRTASSSETTISGGTENTMYLKLLAKAFQNQGSCSSSAKLARPTKVLELLMPDQSSIE